MRISFFFLLLILGLGIRAQDNAQRKYLHIGLNLVVPDHEPLFRENFDGRPGAQVRYSKHIKNGIAFGLGAQTYTVRAITNNQNSFNVTKADFYSGNFTLSYDLISKTKTFLSPFLEVGATYVDYNFDEPSNFTSNLGAGIRFLYFMEDLYGLEIDLNYFTILSPFSPTSFPENNTSMRFIMIRLGFALDLTKI